MSRHFFATLLALLLAGTAVAQDTGATGAPGDDEFDLFDDDVESTKEGWPRFHALLGFARVDGDGHYDIRETDGDRVSIIDFDRAGLQDKDSSYWLTLSWRSDESRWGAWFGSWQFDVTGSRVWKEELELPGKPTIPIDASVTSAFDTRWYILEATYSFHRTETLDAGVGIGLHAVDLDTGLTARIDTGDANAHVVNQTLDTLAPLPNVVLYAYWKFAPRWLLTARTGYFSLSYDKYDGRMLNAHAMFNYELSPRWSLGLGYQFVELDLDVEKSDYTKIYDFSFAGTVAYLSYRF